MVEIKDFDADSYELEFEENTLEDERKFYVQNYPNVNMVADRRLHCTTCDTHLGCAVANEQTIRMHPVLRVTHCKKCHTFYNSGEFSKGEDGSELYCRWCGQGGEVYCCSKCPYVFCKKCILQNLSKNVITEIESNDDWQCFRCSPNVMWPLRAQHWALVNYIEKTKKRILHEEKEDDQIYELMNKDPTLCCKEKKTPKSRKSAKGKRRRRVSSTSDSDCSTPEPKRIPDHSAILPKLVIQAPQKTSKKLDELVCTPDILSMFSEPAEESSRPPTRQPVGPLSKTVSALTSATLSHKSAPSQPPPLIIRQLPSSSSVQTVRFPNRQFAAVPRVAAPPPAYYTVNGYRVDLNAAAQQETYRLPNGKLIQVKKQTAANQASGAPNAPNRNASLQQPRPSNPNPYSIRFNIQPDLQQPTQTVQIPHHVPSTAAHQTSAAQTLHQQHLQQQQQILNGMTNVQMVPTASAPATIVSNRYPNTPLGHAQTGLEKEIQGAQEICQQIVGKCNTLMKSNAYKSVRSFNDVKDLHLHLSYLFTYTIDKFTSLQTKCQDAMKSLTNAHEAANKLADKKNKYTNVDDDLEVVEPTTVCIEIDSDDEAEPRRNDTAPTIVEKPKSKQPRKSTHRPKQNEAVSVAETLPVQSIEIVDNDELELPTPPALDSEDEPTPLPLDSEDEPYDRESDEKLKSLPKVVLEKDEEIERRLKEILGKQQSENGAASPVNDDSDVQINDTIEESLSETNAGHKSQDNGEKDDDAVVSGEKDDDAANKNDKDLNKSEVDDAETIEKDEELNENDAIDNDDDEHKVEDNDDRKVEDTDDRKVEDNDDRKVEDNEKLDDEEKVEKIDKSNDCNRDVVRIEDLTNGDGEDESMADCTDVRSPVSPALTDNLDNDLLDEMDHQNNLTDNSFENISSPDMFDDMSKNGFDKATEDIVTLSTENADPDLV